jgi:hypothetical protein
MEVWIRLRRRPSWTWRSTRTMLTSEHRSAVDRFGADRAANGSPRGAAGCLWRARLRRKKRSNWDWNGWLDSRTRAPGLWSLTGPVQRRRRAGEPIGGDGDGAVGVPRRRQHAPGGQARAERVAGHRGDGADAGRGRQLFPGGPLNHHLYSQAMATIAICELYGMTKDPKYRAPAQKAWTMPRGFRRPVWAVGDTSLAWMPTPR